MPDPEKNHMREIMQVQKPCILQTWPLETLCATAWLFFIPMRDLRETTVGPLMDALDYNKNLVSAANICFTEQIIGFVKANIGFTE